MTNIDTENAQISECSVNGEQATMITKEGVVTLVWMNKDYYYIMWADGDKDFMMAIADSITIVN